MVIIISTDYQRFSELNFQKLSKTTQNISEGISNISNEDLIEYLKQESSKQQKRDRFNLILSIITAIVAIATLIATIVK